VGSHEQRWGIGVELAAECAFEVSREQKRGIGVGLAAAESAFEVIHEGKSRTVVDLAVPVLGREIVVRTLSKAQGQLRGLGQQERPLLALPWACWVWTVDWRQRCSGGDCCLLGVHGMVQLPRRLIELEKPLLTLERKMRVKRWLIVPGHSLLDLDVKIYLPVPAWRPADKVQHTHPWEQAHIPFSVDKEDPLLEMDWKAEQVGGLLEFRGEMNLQSCLLEVERQVLQSDVNQEVC
jgi:hypothetical protein